MSMYVITHKKFDYKTPKGYIPLLVGANFNKNEANYLSDNVGNNISDKNKSFCELTGIYWIWKNSSEKNVGISHYRRYFSKKNSLGVIQLESLIKKYPDAIKVDEMDMILNNYDWIVPRVYSIPKLTVYQQFSKTHNIQDLEVTKQVIKEIHPNYIEAFNTVMNSYEMSLANMCYARKEVFDNYCKWLFDILFEVEKRTDITKYTEYQKRLYGFLAERLMNVWMEKNKDDLKIKHLSTFNTTTENRAIVLEKVKKKILNKEHF